MQLNDVHSRLNATEIAYIERPRDESEVVALVRRARAEGSAICPFGGRHAMGGQQFCAGAIAVDTSDLLGTPQLDHDRGLLTIGAGAHWPAVIAATWSAGKPTREGGGRWGIRQKQTGADDMSLGGSVSANAHGRGMGIGPLVDDVEGFRIVTANGDALRCSRAEHPDLFSLAIGGYGMFGIITEVTLRLAERRKLRRVVDIIDLDDAINAARRRFNEGCLYGDFQYAIDPSDDSFLRRGVMACYTPVSESVPVSPLEADLSQDRWLELLELAHTDKARAFALYAQYYLTTHGRVYWSDTMQLSTYIPAYSDFLATRLKAGGPDESLMITELYVPPDALAAFMLSARSVLRTAEVEDIYGTIRSIRRDTTTFLPWAKQDYACIIFNLRTPHTCDGVGRTRETCRRLIDAAIELNGSFYLTYHGWATRPQLQQAYPRLGEWFKQKRTYDSDELFQSAWYRRLKEVITEPGSGLEA